MKISDEVYTELKQMQERSNQLGSTKDLKMGRVCIPAGTGFGDGYKCAVNTIVDMIEENMKNDYIS